MTGVEMRCPRCGAPVSLRDRASRAVTCPACRGLSHVREGALAWVEELPGRYTPTIPLGAKGTLRGQALQVLGWLRQTTRIEGTTYAWEEYLLHGRGGYRWFSVYEGHWLFLEPLAAGRATVADAGRTARSGGRTFKHFQTALATADELQGEFHWDIRAGETATTEDYVAPPHLLSVEKAPGEEVWTSGEYVAGAEVWAAFALPGKPPRAVGVGSAQPNPHRGAAGLWKVALVALLALAAIALTLAKATPREIVASLDVPLGPNGLTVSEPFELSGRRQALEVVASADVEQAWVGLDVALIEDATGESELVGVELAHYSGVDEEGTWQEGSRSGSTVIGYVAPGRYILRVEPVSEAQPGGRVPAIARVTVQRGVFLATPLLLAFLLVIAWPIGASVRASAFERRRWDESDHPWGGDE